MSFAPRGTSLETILETVLKIIFRTTHLIDAVMAMMVPGLC
jgi:hypothetical protein